MMVQRVNWRPPRGLNKSHGALGHVAPCPHSLPACSIRLRSVHRTARCGLAFIALT